MAKEPKKVAIIIKELLSKGWNPTKDATLLNLSKQKIELLGYAQN